MLEIHSCDDLVEVRRLPSTLITLKLNWSSTLREIEGLYGLSKLQMLDISGCKKVEMISIESLESLEEL